MTADALASSLTPTSSPATQQFLESDLLYYARLFIALLNSFSPHLLWWQTIPRGEEFSSDSPTPHLCFTCLIRPLPLAPPPPSSPTQLSSPLPQRRDHGGTFSHRVPLAEPGPPVQRPRLPQPV